MVAVQLDGHYPVTDLDLSVGEDVRPHAAAVNQRAENRTPGVALYDGAWLAQQHPAAAHAAEHEFVADELVQLDSVHHQVVAVIIRR